MSIHYVQALTQYLAGSGTIVGATSIVLTSFTDIYGNVLTMSDFGTKGYITLEPETTNEEAATFTGVVANANGTYTLTGVSTILAESPYTETSGLVRQHSGGTELVITDNVGFWDTFTNKNNDETITGAWHVPTGGTGTQIANATDIANAITGASGTATNLVAGTTKLSVAAASVPNPIAVGTNDPRVPTQGENDALVGTSGTPSSSNRYITDADATATPTANKVIRYGDTGSTPGVQNMFGSGVDGNVTIASGTTTLTRDMFYNNLTLQTGAILQTGGYQIFVADTLTQEGTGYIQNNGDAGGSGGNATLSTPGTAGTAGAAPAGVTVPIGKAGVVGKAGGNSSSNGAAGTAGIAAVNSLGSSGISFTGASGGGGGGINSGSSAGVAGANGTSGTATASISKLADYVSAKILGIFSTGTYTIFSGNGSNATSGGAGGGGNAVGGTALGGAGGGSGGSGGNGGWVVVFARHIVVNSGVVLFQAKGGAGGNGGNGGNGATNPPFYGGGGGAGSLGVGGNGGMVVSVYETTSAAITYDVTPGANGSAGTPGNGGGGGAGNGTASTFTGTPISGQTIELDL